MAILSVGRWWWGGGEVGVGVEMCLRLIIFQGNGLILQSDFKYVQKTLELVLVTLGMIYVT